MNKSNHHLDNQLQDPKPDSLNFLPSFLVKDLENNDEEQDEEEEENETFDNEDFNLASYQSNMSHPSQTYLNQPLDFKYPSFDDLNQYRMNYFPMNQYNMIPMQQQQQRIQNPYPNSSGIGYGNNFLPIQQTNYVFNSFNYLPNQSMPVKTKEKKALGKPKLKKVSMLNSDMSSLMNSFQKERVLAEPMRMQSHTQAFPFNQPQKIKTKKSKKNQKNNSDKNSEHPATLTSFLSLPDKDLFSYIITQKGSREVQSILKKAKDKDVEMLLVKLSSNFPDIMINKYGNYFSQKLIQICSLSQRVALLEMIRPRFSEISCNSFGTHPLQSLIEIINLPKEREILVQSIENKEIELSLDANGTHVIQKLISCTTNEERETINNNIVNHIGDLINDSCGVCVLIKLIKHSTTMSLKERISSYISKNNPLCFIQGPFSNYLVQCLFNKTDIVLCKEIIKVIVDNFFSLSMQKFSSNVVENCIRFSEEAIVMKIYNDAITFGKVGAMLKNTYGAFVIEKLVARLNKEQKAEIIKEVHKLGKETNLSNTLLVLLYK